MRDADAVISERPRGVQPWQGSEGRRGWKRERREGEEGRGEEDKRNPTGTNQKRMEDGKITKGV